MNLRTYTKPKHTKLIKFKIPNNGSNYFIYNLNTNVITEYNKHDEIVNPHENTVDHKRAYELIYKLNHWDLLNTNIYNGWETLYDKYKTNWS